MIELLKEKDIEETIAVGAELHKESIWASIPFDNEYADKYIRLILQNPKFGFILVVKIQDKIVGGIVALVSRFPFSSEKYSDVYLLFLKEEYRKGDIAIHLVSAYIAQAKTYKVREIHIGVNSPVNKEKVEKLYGFMGFEQVGTNWAIISN